MILPLLMLAAGTDLRPANMAQCRAETAVAVTVEQLTVAPRQFEGKCVTVSGPAWYRSMYSGIDGFYLTYRLGPEGHTSEEGLRHRLGLYFPGAQAGLESMRTLSVTGVADSCERMGRVLDAQEKAEQRRRKRAGSDVIVIHMLGGYCHYHPGPVIWVTDFKQDVSLVYERRVGEAARQRLGSLVHVAPEWPRYAGLRGLADAVREAIGEGERKGLSTLFGKFGADKSELDLMLVDADSPFRELRDPARQAPLAILADAVDDEGAPADTVERLDGYLCWCRSGDCADLWPIAEVGTWSLRDHPYACLEVYTDGSDAVFLRARRPDVPLREPSAPAFQSPQAARRSGEAE